MTNNISWQIIEVINTLLETLITYWFFKDFLGLNHSRKRYVNVIGFFALFAASSVLYAIIPNPTLTLIFTVFSRFLYAFLFEGNIKYKSVIAFLVTSIELLSEFMAMFIIMILSKVTEQTTLADGPYRMSGIVISSILLLLVTRVLCIAKNRRNLKVPTRYWSILLLMPVLSIFIMHSLFLYSSLAKTEDLKVFSYISGISLLFINYIIFYLFNKLIEDFNIKTHFKLLEQQIDYQASHYKDLEYSNNEMRRLRHDMKNHFQCLNGLILANKTDEVKSYMKSVADIFTVNSQVICTGNPVLDSILNAKLMIMNEKKIDFNYTIEIPNEIKIEPVDICILFGNSLDNAIEACERISSGNKNISLIASYQNNNLAYSLSNSTNGRLVKSGKYFQSSKNDFSEHGLGISNIERTVEKYSGILKIEYNNNIFQLSTLLYNT